MYVNTKQGVKRFLERIKRSKEKQKEQQKIENIPFFLLLSFILIIYAGLQFLIYQPNQDVYQQFLSNLNEDIIVDFYIQWNEQTCLKKDYQPLFQYNYSRVIKGCDCSQRRNKTGNEETKIEIIIGKGCTQKYLNQGCFTFNQELYQNISYLNNNEFGSQFLICVKRQKDISLKYNHTYCQQQEKTICKAQDLIYCLPKNISCPISEFGIKAIEEINPNFTNSLTYLGNNKYFYFGYNDNNMPISQVQLTKGENICKLNKQQAFSEQQLYTENQKQACEENDHLFSQIYAILEEQLFLSNNLFYYKDGLSYFYIDRIHNWTLQAKPYILISPLCQQNEYYQKMLTNEYQTEINQQRILQLTFIFVIFLFRILQIFINYYFYKHFQEERKTNNHFIQFIKKIQQKKNQYQNLGCCNIYTIISVIILFCYLFLIVLIKLNIDSIFEEIEQLLSIPCIVRDDANNYLKYSIQDHPVQLFLSLLYYTFIILQIITVLIYILEQIGLKKDRLYKQNNKQLIEE
ncbi:unnamed protein product [Paramecium pentaurelia]|uniref:Transmembrane protein n=1 Tax=Paramecium pentaurelia TaxID=43138 RepID=A0A8S1TCA8_9CILI|nr:unnamed protein product [Paramecium pentaurelia]